MRRWYVQLGHGVVSFVSLFALCVSFVADDVH